MPKFFKILALLILAFSFSSCIELVEEIKINADLSGKYHLYLKHNGLGFLFESAPEFSDFKELENVLHNFERQKGISNASSEINLKKGIFSVRFDFSDAKSLTQAFYASFGAKKQFYHKSFLKVSRYKIKRPDLSNYIAKYVETKGILDQMPSEKILGFVKYRYRVFSHKTIESAQPANINTGSNPLEYNQIYSLEPLLLGKQSTKSVIRLKK